MYKIDVTRTINGVTISDNKFDFLKGMTFADKQKAANMISGVILSMVEDSDPIFGGYRTELVNEGTTQENYRFGWACDADDTQYIAEENGWFAKKVDEDTLLQFNIVNLKPQPKYNVSVGKGEFSTDASLALRINVEKGQKSYLCINTSECDEWAYKGEKPLIQPMLSLKDFECLGFSYAHYLKACNLKIGGIIDIFNECDGDYEGVYIMRVS